MPQIKDIWLHAHHILRSARQIINENLGPLNLSSAEGNILIHLLTQGNDMGQEQLVEQLDISKPAVSRALDSLEMKGFVIREQDPDDRRAHKVHLTGKAHEIGADIEQVYNQIYALALQGISQEEFSEFVKLFDRIAENFARENSKK
jgi:MarR family transcriptional regulator for hemolysin